MENHVVLELKSIGKNFGATCALKGVSLSVGQGEIHALIGENGAGKSTLMKILSGAYRLDEGEILLNGRPAPIHSPLRARKLGIAMIYQELNLAPHLTVEENATLGMETTTAGFVRSQRARVAEVFKLLGHPSLPLDAPISTLGTGSQQLVEIARALLCDARVLILDEPTSSLTSSDTRALFEVLKRLKQNGLSIIYISHFLEEVKEIADSYTVLRDGVLAGNGRMDQTSIPELIRLMVGRSLNEMFPKNPREEGGVLLKVTGAEGLPLPKGLSLELHRGEILGIAGLVGSGRSETLRCLFGLNPSRGGVLTVGGKESRPLNQMRPPRSLWMGLDFLSENRKEEGLAVGLSVGDNMTLSSLGRWGKFGFLSLGLEKQGVESRIRELGVKCQGPGQRIGNLSGGNQQKVALARLMEQGGEVLLLDEPTRGVDVGSKVEIYRLIQELAAKGRGIIFVSSYLPELLGVCDRLAVMHRGRLSRVKRVGEWNEAEIMRVATSGD